MRLVFSALVLLAATARAALAQESPSYARHVRPFIIKYCVECHNAKVDKRGLNLDTYKAMQEGSDLGPVILPGKPGESKLIQLIEEKKDRRMPPKSSKRFPTIKEIAQVRAWVAAGAKDDSALVKVEIPEIKPQSAQPGSNVGVAFTPKYLLAARSGQLVSYRSDTEKRGNSVSGDLPITALTTEGAKRVAIAWGKPGHASRVTLYENTFEGADSVRAMELPSRHQDTILDLAFQPSGALLATASYDTTVVVWSLRSLESVHTLREHSDSVYAVGFSPDGKLLASGGADRAVKIWDTATWKLLYTLGESTDWVYTLAWSPDGKHLAAAGVDKSIRVWEASANKHTLVHSVFAHEAPITKLIYGTDGKTLYSLGEDRIVKAWDAARMVERRVYDKQPETVLAMAISPDQKQIALGRYDGVIVLLDEATGKVQRQIRPETKTSPKKSSLEPQIENPPSTFSVRGEAPKKGDADAKRKPDASPKDKFPTVQEQEPNNSPGAGQLIRLSAMVAGSLDRAGDVDYYRFEVKAGQQVGAYLAVKETSKLEPFLRLVDGDGNTLAESSSGLLGHTFARAGTYAIGVRDRELRGGPGMTYYLHIGDVPVVTEVFPLGAARGNETEVRIDGVFLDSNRVKIKVPADAMVGSKIAVPVTSVKGTPLGQKNIVVGEFLDVRAGAKAQPAIIPVPATANGEIATAGEVDLWKFTAKKGQRLIVEVNARRLGSSLDSFIEILDSKNQPVPRAVLRSQARTYVTFRDHDSAQGNIRIEAWGELGVNDYIYVGSELLKIRSLPTHPDADCVFFSDRGQRVGYLDTTPTHLSNGLPMYKVAIHPAGTIFPPNGFPVITMYYRNDDGGPGYGRDSRLFFDPPADGEYRIRIGDSRGQGGTNFGYRLTVRPPRPGFNVTFNPTAPSVYRGGAIPVTATAERIDGYEGEIALKFDNLPPGFSAPLTTIPAGENSTAFALYASADAMNPVKPANLKLLASAVIDGKTIGKEIAGGLPKVIDAGEIVTATMENEVAVKPGGTVKLSVQIERRGGFKGRVPIDVRGLPHGVKVLDLGLNGILITERETRRTIVIYAEPWVQPTEHPFVVLARREGKNTEHAAKSVMLKVR